MSGGKPAQIYKTGPLYFVALLFLLIVASVTGINIGALIAAVGFAALLLPALVSELRDWRSRRWRFSLRTLLIVMTLVAVAIGLIVALAQ